MNEQLLIDLCGEIGIHLNSHQVQCFSRYYEELLIWNKKFNLTAIEDEQGVIVKHFLDSLLGSQVSGWNSTGRLLDLGSGAGFPGVPLKIVFPDLQVTLVDSLQKRVRFLEHLIESLNLTGITAIHKRAEELGQDQEERESYDIVVSRAVAKLPVLCEFCLPLVRKGGIFLAYKGPEAHQELENASKAIEILGGERKELVEKHLPFNGGQRLLVVLEKVHDTPSKYPRKPGTAEKKPL